MARKVAGEPYTRISAEEADEMIKAGGSVVVDVRRDDEYHGGHVKGCLLYTSDAADE